MKAIVTEKEVKTPKYNFPILMREKTNGQIIMFTDMTSGIAMSEGAWPIGEFDEYHTCYNTDIWEPFTGTITLSND